MGFLSPPPPPPAPPPLPAAASAISAIVAVVFAFVFLGEWWSRIFYEVLTVLWFPLGRGAVKKVDDVLEELETVSPEAFARVEAATEAGTAKAVFVFTRHLGCPCAEATAARVHALAATTSREVLYVLVMPGTPEASRAFLELATKKQGPAFAVSASHNLLLVGDAAGKLYSYFGVPVTGPMHMLKSSSAARAALAAEGHVNTTPGGGSRYQSAAAFVALLSKAKRPVVGAVHLPEHALDVPNVEQLLASAKAETIIERIRTSFTMVRAPSTTAMM